MSLRRSDWADSLERYEIALDEYTASTPWGDQYIKEGAPAALVKMYDHLICVGLEHGWLDLHIDTADNLTTTKRIAA